MAPPPIPNPAIETRSLTRHFDEVTAMEGLSLSVPRGTFFGFLGPNGAGKSTTLKMLTGLLAPSSGSIRILGMDPGDPAQALAIKRKVGVVPEKSALFDNLTAREYLTFVGRMHQLPADVVTIRCGEL
jgi:ABC-2 type transport system ATP-binding protein